MTDLSSIPRMITPPPELEQKIARELRRQGLLHRRRMTFAYLAAAIVIALIVWQVRPAKPSPNYILLLYESPQFMGGNRAEYGQWARQMQPLIAGGEELGATELAVAGNNTPLPNTTPKLAGYFLIDADDDAGAMRVARACPHLKHGGAVVLRKIVQ